MGFLVELAAHDEQYLFVHLHELDPVVVDLAHLLNLARLWLAVRVWAQACQEDTLVRAHDKLSHFIDLALEACRLP